MKQTPQTKKSRRTKTMTEYMMKTDKNGKPRYYKSVDGKMKVISRAEYEENVKAEVEEVKSEAIVPAGFWNLDAAITELAERDRLNSVDMTPSKPEDVALSVVKRIVSGMDGRDDGKVKMQTVKHGVLINYRNCMVCALVFDDDHVVTAIKFMGTTVESRKKSELCEVKDLSEYADKISEQVVFIDQWWANTSRKKVA
jgi:hypothetical protein